MSLRELYEEKKKTYGLLKDELNRIKAYEQQITNELLRLEGELRLLEELMSKENVEKEDVIKAEDIC